MGHLNHRVVGNTAPWTLLATAAVITSTLLPGQFTGQYAGVQRHVRSKPLPVVVMLQEPNTPYSHDRVVLFGRSGTSLLQIAKNRGSAWHRRDTISFVPGIPPVDDPVPLYNNDGNTVSVFVCGLNGSIYQASGGRSTPFGEWSNWRALPNNVLMAGTPTAINTPTGTGVSVFARGRDGRCYTAFYSRSSSRWGTWSLVNGSPAMRGRPTAVNSPSGGELHLLLTDSAGKLRHTRYLRNGRGGWTGTWSVVSPGTLHRVHSPNIYSHGSLISVVGVERGTTTGTIGSIVQSSYHPSTNTWSTYSAVGRPANASDRFVSVSAINSPDGATFDVIAKTERGTVERNSYRRNGGGGWTGFADWQVGGRLTGAVALTNWHTQRATRAQIRSQIFGSGDSVQQWFFENSKGRYRISEALVSNWMIVRDDPATAVDESSYAFLHGSDNHAKAKALVQYFEQRTGFRFSDYDTNSDGKITQDECLVYWIYPGEGARVRPAPACIQVPSLGNGCGVSLELGLPRSAARMGAETIAHEMCHALFGVDDLYATSALPQYVPPGQLAMMSNQSRFPHLNPWAKMKLGWVTPTIVGQDGWYDLRPIETHDDLLLIHNPNHPNQAHRFKDYFLVENRRPIGIERRLPDQGIGVWRVGEHYASATRGQAHWGRRTIKLIRARGTSDSTAFFDSANPLTSSDLTPTSTPSTVFDNNVRSNIAIYRFPDTTQRTNGRVYIDFPPLRGSGPPPYQSAQLNYIDQRGGFSNPNPPWMVAPRLPKIGATFAIQVPHSHLGAAFYLILGASNPDQMTPFGYQYANWDIVLPSPFNAGAGTYTFSFALPNDPALTGASLYTQPLRRLGTSWAYGRGSQVLLGY